MANIIEVIIRARNELAGELNKAEASVSRFGVSSIAKFFGASVSIAAAGLALRKMVGDAAEAERAEVLLADAMRRRGIYTREVAARTIESANALSRHVRATDEDIKAVQTSLIDSGVQLDMLQRATEATLDLATAKRMDGVSAAQLLRVALISESGAIRGITTEAAGAAGSAERLNSIMAQLNEKFGGKAQADANTMAGIYANLGKQTGEALELIGTGLNKIGKPLAKSTIDNLIGIQEALTVVGNAAIWVGESFAWMFGKTLRSAEAPGKMFELPEVVILGKNTEDTAEEVYTLADALERLRKKTHDEAIDAQALNIVLAEQWKLYEGIAKSVAASMTIRPLRTPRVLPFRAEPMPEPEAAPETGLEELMRRADEAATEIEQTINTKLVDATLAGVDQMAAGVGDAFGRMLFYGENFAKGFKEAVKSMAASVVAAIMQMYIKWLLLKALQLIGIPMPFASGGQISGVPSGGAAYAQSGILAGGIPGRDSILVRAMAGERMLSVETNQRLDAALSKILAGGSRSGTTVFNTLDAYTLRDWFLYGPGRRMMRRAGVEV